MHAHNMQHEGMSRGTPATSPRHLRPRRGAAFADLILTARQTKGLTQAGLATRAGLDRTTVIRWEAGDITRPEPGQVRSACAVLDVRYTDALIALGTLTPADMAA